MHGDEFDLTDDFRERIHRKPARGHDRQDLFQRAARRTRRGRHDRLTNKGTYTACAACKDNPDKPPLWRVRAKRIIHKNNEQMLYYEDAALEFLGLPIAYVPFFSAPDPTVTRKSGILSPHYINNTYLGIGVRNSDLLGARAGLRFDLHADRTFATGISGQRRMASAIRRAATITSGPTASPSRTRMSSRSRPMAPAT